MNQRVFMDGVELEVGEDVIPGSIFVEKISPEEAEKMRKEVKRRAAGVRAEVKGLTKAQLIEELVEAKEAAHCHVYSLVKVEARRKKEVDEKMKEASNYKRLWEEAQEQFRREQIHSTHYFKALTALRVSLAMMREDHL